MSLLPPFADTDEDGAVSALIRSACRWHVWPAVTDTLVLDGSGSDLLRLPSLNVTAITAVSETERGAGKSPVTVDPADLEWSAAGLVWRHDRRCWTARARGVSVTFTHGLAELPEELATLAASVVQRLSANPLRLAQITVGQRSESYGSTGAGSALFLMDELQILAPYRRLS